MTDEAAAATAPPVQRGPHKTLLSVDQTNEAEARRHILLPVDDTDVRIADAWTPQCRCDMQSRCLTTSVVHLCWVAGL